MYIVLAFKTFHYSGTSIKELMITKIIINECLLAEIRRSVSSMEVSPQWRRSLNGGVSLMEESPFWRCSLNGGVPSTEVSPRWKCFLNGDIQYPLNGGVSLMEVLP